ncbi:MAG: hypothetical protein RIC19_17655 [Phaeodactylibacter sp.]|uniref:hypothetical protein n=1 Tax=Phaeodactylibacter sp. TaxID=1940289 RepID=UPI0032EEA45D
MNVPAEKYRLIEWVINLQDVDLLKELLAIRRASEGKAGMNEIVGSAPDGSPITVEELIARAEESERDIEAGRVSDIDEVMERLLGS